jgi:RES domain-containing protein
VHLKLPVSSKFVVIPLQFDDALVETVPLATLRPGWDAEPPSLISQQIGDDWVRSTRSVVLALPSVITRETNYLINPVHPDFGKIETGKPEPFTFDPRLLGLQKP